jgi:hypothetical protein
MHCASKKYRLPFLRNQQTKSGYGTLATVP